MSLAHFYKNFIQSFPEMWVLTVLPYVSNPNKVGLIWLLFLLLIRIVHGYWKLLQVLVTIIRTIRPFLYRVNRPVQLIPKYRVWNWCASADEIVVIILCMSAILCFKMSAFPRLCNTFRLTMNLQSWGEFVCVFHWWVYLSLLVSVSKRCS